MPHDMWTRSVSTLSPLSGEALIWLWLPDKRGRRKGNAESGTLLNTPSLCRAMGWLALGKQRPHRGQIQSNVLTADRSNQSVVGCCSPLGFSLKGKLAGLGRSQMQRQNVVGGQDETAQTMFHSLCLQLRYLDGILFYCITKNCTPSFQQDKFLVIQQVQAQT